PRFGKEFTEDVYQEFISHASKPFINSVVLQGGDILSRFNYREGIELCRKLKRDLPDKNIVIFTGYTYEDLQNDLLRQPALLVADYIVDGQYEHDKPTKKPFRGSDRQRILHLSSTGTILGES
ncbi:MAG: radical SAM protein, partial [Colwellia sp.]|nr:radical SAM protein [Colwellia sp.]